jgi:hypothetical protein
LSSTYRDEEEEACHVNPIANKKDEEKVVQWTAPVGLPPPHKLESIKPLTGTNAESRGKLLADEL